MDNVREGQARRSMHGDIKRVSTARLFSGRREADNVSDAECCQNIYIHRRRTRSRAAEQTRIRTGVH